MAGVAAILTVLHEPADRLARRFTELARQDERLDEVVVAAPIIEHAAIRAAAPPSAPFTLRLVDNPGGQRSPGLNLAGRAATADLLVRVDARSALSPTHVSACTGVLRARPEVGVVGGPQVPLPGGTGVVARGIARALSNPWALGGAAYRQVGRAGAVDTVYLGAFRRGELLGLGGYDERLVANEDFDLCQRYRASGAVVWLEPGAEVAYESRTSLRSVASQYFAFGRSKACYWRLTGNRALGRQRFALAGATVGAVLAVSVARSPRLAMPAGLALVTALCVVDESGSSRPVSSAVRAVALGTYPLIWTAWVTGIADGTFRRRR